MLLNTDLHVAKGHSRMTRATFVRNTLATIAAYSNIDRPVTAVTVNSENADSQSIRSVSSEKGGSTARYDLGILLKVIQTILSDIMNYHP